MKKIIIITSLQSLLLAACFWGNENYEKEVNAFFFLYSKPETIEDVCLGTFQHGEHRFTDGYLCAIKKIGWNRSFMIMQNKNGKYFIQDFRKLDRESPNQYKNDLYGPMTLSTFNLKCDSLQVDKDLDFELDY